jgi:hypothetical protein
MCVLPSESFAVSATCNQYGHQTNRVHVQHLPSSEDWIFDFDTCMCMCTLLTTCIDSRMHHEIESTVATSVGLMVKRDTIEERGCWVYKVHYHSDLINYLVHRTRSPVLSPQPKRRGREVHVQRMCMSNPIGKNIVENNACSLERGREPRPPAKRAM